MAIPARSDFYVIPQFPEVYHGQGITTQPFSGGERAVTGQGRDTTYRVTVSWKTATSCVAGPLLAGGVRRDPELGVFGSQEKKGVRDKN